ncbi:hypothetical protein B0T13DRAFT_524021 [Neurospora crassa]|nr:hypothetical protein B0T13DRAFT_524021 [Neurospora crassa]
MAEAKPPSREKASASRWSSAPWPEKGLPYTDPQRRTASRRWPSTHQARVWDHRRGRYSGPSCGQKSIPLGSWRCSNRGKRSLEFRQRSCHRPPTPSQRVQSRDCVNGSKCYNCGDSPCLTLGGTSLRPTCVVHLDRRSRGYLHPRDVIGRLAISNLSRHGFIGNSSMGSHGPSVMPLAGAPPPSRTSALSPLAALTLRSP